MGEGVHFQGKTAATPSDKDVLKFKNINMNCKLW
jgi:hypothetical protein